MAATAWERLILLWRRFEVRSCANASGKRTKAATTTTFTGKEQGPQGYMNSANRLIELRHHISNTRKTNRRIEGGIRTRKKKEKEQGKRGIRTKKKEKLNKKLKREKEKNRRGRVRGWRRG